MIVIHKNIQNTTLVQKSLIWARCLNCFIVLFVLVFLRQEVQNCLMEHCRHFCNPVFCCYSTSKFSFAKNAPFSSSFPSFISSPSSIRSAFHAHKSWAKPIFWGPKNLESGYRMWQKGGKKDQQPDFAPICVTSWFKNRAWNGCFSIVIYPYCTYSTFISVIFLISKSKSWLM